MIIKIIHVCCCSGLSSDSEAPTNNCGDDIFSRENSAACTPPSPLTTDASPPSPIVKDAAAVEEESGRASSRSLSFLGTRRDGDVDASPALDFSVGTFAGDALCLRDMQHAKHQYSHGWQSLMTRACTMMQLQRITTCSLLWLRGEGSRVLPGRQKTDALMRAWSLYQV